MTEINFICTVFYLKKTVLFNKADVLRQQLSGDKKQGRVLNNEKEDCAFILLLSGVPLVITGDNPQKCKKGHFLNLFLKDPQNFT